MLPPLIQFDKGPLPNGTLFENASAIIEAKTADEVPAAFAALETARAEGFWLAGLVSYELGYALIPELTQTLQSHNPGSLLRFGVFKAPLPPKPLPEHTDFTLSEFCPEWSFGKYSNAFNKISNYLKSGDIYQANLTFPLQADFTGAPISLYQSLSQKQPVPHGAYLDFGDEQILSRSPELFFSLSSGGQLTTRPMKGTSKRGQTPAEDDALKLALSKSEKNRAENLMITDLLRNDFGRIATIGSVSVPQLFHVETYATVHQMISEVTAQLKSNTGIADIFKAIFPCGSITGAPKIRAMQIIAELEQTPRGPYCGAIGWMAPDGAMEFNVAIRTLIHRDGKLRLNVGGGVVYDSTAEDEYAEALLKTRFASKK